MKLPTEKTLNLIPLRRGTSTLTSLSTQLSLFRPVIVEEKKPGGGKRRRMAKDTVNTRVIVPLSRLKNALNSIGLCLQVDEKPGSLLQVSIVGMLERSEATGEMNLCVTSGIGRFAELSIYGESQTDKALPAKFSSTSPNQQTSRTSLAL